jgi:hypothetical protein
MLTADGFAKNLTGILAHFLKTLMSDETVAEVTGVEYLGGGRIKIVTNEGGDVFSYHMICSGAEMVQPEDTSPPMPPLESKERNQEVITETQPQGVGERIDRKVRPPKITPTTREPGEKTPRRPANNDPTKTPRGKAALKKQIRKNKQHPEKFESKFLDKALVAERNDIMSLAEFINPIVEFRIIRGLMEHGDSDGKLSQINEVIHNVWSARYIEEHIGVAKSRADELKVFGDAGLVLDEFKDWGAQLCWIERIRKPGFAIYKVCGDAVPSKTYIEHKADSKRDLILSADHANIIPEIFGDL